MDKIKVQVIAVALGAGALFLCVTPANADTRFDRMIDLERNEHGRAPAAPVPPEQAVIRKPNLEYKSEKLRDPFRKPVEESTVKPGGSAQGEGEYGKELPPQVRSALAIQGIIWGGKFPQAIINHKVIRVGDEIADTRIIEINPDGVSVLFEDRIYKVPVTTLDNLLQGAKGGKK